MGRIMVVIATMVFAGLISGCGKPAIEYQCTMNGLGSGSCNFTNTGDGSGAICGHILVLKKDAIDNAESSRFCSGEVQSSSTTTVSFAIPSVQRVCPSSIEKSWTDSCSFVFLED